MMYALNDPRTSLVFFDCFIVLNWMTKCVLLVRIKIYIYLYIYIFKYIFMVKLNLWLNLIALEYNNLSLLFYFINLVC